MRSTAWGVGFEPQRLSGPEHTATNTYTVLFHARRPSHAQAAASKTLVDATAPSTTSDLGMVSDTMKSLGIPVACPPATKVAVSPATPRRTAPLGQQRSVSDNDQVITHHYNIARFRV